MPSPAHKIKTIVGAAIIIAAASFASRLTGVLRDAIFTHQFGAGDVLDAYYAAFRIPDFIFNLLIIGALSSGFIPVFTKLIHDDETEAWRVTNSVINILGLLLLIICGILFVFAPCLMPLLVPGFPPEKIQLATTLTRIMFMSPILLGLSSVIGGVLQSYKSFFIYSITPILYNVGIILGALLFVPAVGIQGLAYGVVLGALLHLIIQIPTLYKLGFRYQALFLWKNPHVQKIGLLMIPRTLGLAANQINYLITLYLASQLPSGNVTIFQLANNLQNVPVGIIGASFAIAVFPALATAVAKNNPDDFNRNLFKTIRQILFCILPITIIFFLFRTNIVAVLLGRGQFKPEHIIETANVLAFFSLSLFAQCLTLLLARAFYAFGNTKTPFIIIVTTSIVDVAASVFLRNYYGILGLAMGFSIGNVLQVILLYIFLRKKIQPTMETQTIKFLCKIGTAALFMVGITSLTKYAIVQTLDITHFFGILSQAAIAGILGFLVYGLICYLLHVDEIILLKEAIHKKWPK